MTANNLTANNAVLTGTLKIGGKNIKASDLQSGAQSAYDNSSKWSTGSNYGYNYNNATKQNGGSYPSYFEASTLCCRSLIVEGEYFRWGDAGLTLRLVDPATATKVLGY